MSHSSPANPVSPADESSTAHLTALQDLIDVVAKLRSPDGGCPWDLEQTPTTLIPYVIEEAYEVADAIRQGDPDDIADELGDLLLQVVLQSQIASETSQFSIKEVAEAITAKLIRRHPHVFGSVEVDNIAEVHANWEAIKAAEERGEKPTVVDDAMLAAQPEPPRLTPKLQKYARSLPPLMACHKISKKAASAGFEWDSVDGVWEKFHEELDEFHHAIDHESKARQQAELGDLFFTLVNIARWHGLDPSEALQSTNTRFINRFAQVEDAAGRSLADFSLDELEQFWQAAKTKLAQQEKQNET
ncbi:MAG: nucleoside triphosphate pyrophosphohydrolase [Cyanobacteria bacterium J06626_14]